jgi:pre-mRNA-splicing factor CWC22
MIRELFKNNIIRGRGLLARNLFQAQIASPLRTPVYAAAINTKFPPISELIIKRLISSFRRAYQGNDKVNCLLTARFLLHLVN